MEFVSRLALFAEFHAFSLLASLYQQDFQNTLIYFGLFPALCWCSVWIGSTWLQKPVEILQER
jgi:hypothetical protein